MTIDEPYRLLLVEDNELDARSLSKALTTEVGCKVERVADLAGGLDAVQRDVFDCVLLDLSLPDSDGLVSVETMVARSPHCPVVVLTGRDDPDLAVAAVERGAQDYLVKNTITPELVGRAIRYAVARHSSETELRNVQRSLESLNEREGIARDLHDTVIQRLFATGMTLQAAANSPSVEAIAATAEQAVAQIDDAIRELRQAIFGLNEADDGESLATDLAQLADTYRGLLGVEPVMRIGEIPHIATSLRRDIIAVATEALSNVTRHAHASAVTVSLFVEDRQLVLRVTDTGEPRPEAHDSDLSAQANAPEHNGRGLTNIRSRAEAHAGTMTFVTHAGGSELSWCVPLPTH